MPEVEHGGHLVLCGAGAGGRARLEREEAQAIVITGVLGERGCDRDVSAFVAVLQLVPTPRGEVKLLALQHADDRVVRSVQRDQLAQAPLRMPEERVSVLPAEDHHPGLAPHVEVAQITTRQGTDVIDPGVVGRSADHRPSEVDVADVILELVEPARRHGRQHRGAILQVSGVTVGQPIRCELPGRGLLRLFTIAHDDGPKPAHFGDEVLGQL